MFSSCSKYAQYQISASTVFISTVRCSIILVLWVWSLLFFETISITRKPSGNPSREFMTFSYSYKNIIIIDWYDFYDHIEISNIAASSENKDWLLFFMKNDEILADFSTWLKIRKCFFLSKKISRSMYKFQTVAFDHEVIDIFWKKVNNKRMSYGNYNETSDHICLEHSGNAYLKCCTKSFSRFKTMLTMSIFLKSIVSIIGSDLLSNLYFQP